MSFGSFLPSACAQRDSETVWVASLWSKLSNVNHYSLIFFVLAVTEIQETMVTTYAAWQVMIRGVKMLVRKIEMPNNVESRSRVTINCFAALKGHMTMRKTSKLTVYVRTDAVQLVGLQQIDALCVPCCTLTSAAVAQQSMIWAPTCTPTVT